MRLVAELCNLKVTKGHTASLSDLLQGLDEPAESIELRFRVLGGKDYTEEVTSLAMSKFRSIAEGSEGWSIEAVNYEGLRVNFGFSVRSGSETQEISGWCMLRPSLHEPILSMQIESDQPGGVRLAAKTILHGETIAVDNGIVTATSNGFKSLNHLVDLSPLLKAAI